MAEAITIACPECDKKITVAAEAVGKKIRCKGCEHVFVIEAPAGKKAAAKPPAKSASAKAPAAAAKKKAPDAKGAAAKPAKPKDDDEDDDNPYGVTSLDTAPRCPDCANEMESEDAVICLHCGYNTQTRQKVATRAVEHLTGMGHFLWLLPGILCVLGILILITEDILFCLRIDYYVADAWFEFVAHPAVKIWHVIMSLFFMYFLGRFAVSRLILHPRPPELVKKKKPK